MLYREFGADCELVVHIEAGCQGHSVLGPKNGFNHPESRALVPMAAALFDLQIILAKQRGFRDWSSAPAQFGYVMENVPGPYNPTQNTDDTKMASAFMDRVFGVPMLHDAAVSGELASRLAKWWTNTFAPEFYAAHEPLFRQKPVKRFVGRRGERPYQWDVEATNSPPSSSVTGRIEHNGAGSRFSAKVRQRAGDSQPENG